MRKSFLIGILIIVILGLLAWIGWMRKANVAAQLLEKHLGVPVSLRSLDFTPQGAVLTDLTIRNPRGYKSRSALTVESIEIDTTLQELRSDPLTIDRIEMDNLLITLEISKSGKTNWDKILGNPSKSPSKRHWLVKTLVLNNLTVQVVQPNGSSKQYPPLGRMEFHNLSDETGFPANEIEKAILNKMMKNLLLELNLQNLLAPFFPQGIPLPWFPSIF